MSGSLNDEQNDRKDERNHRKRGNKMRTRGSRCNCPIRPHEKQIAEEVMKNTTIVFAISFIVSLIFLWLFDVDMWVISFGACIAMAIHIQLMKNKKLAFVLIPTYVVAAVVLYHVTALLLNITDSLRDQVMKMVLLTIIMPSVITISKNVLFTGEKPQNQPQS